MGPSYLRVSSIPSVEALVPSQGPDLLLTWTIHTDLSDLTDPGLGRLERLAPFGPVPRDLQLPHRGPRQRLHRHMLQGVRQRRTRNPYPLTPPTPMPCRSTSNLLHLPLLVSLPVSRHPSDPSPLSPAPHPPQTDNAELFHSLSGSYGSLGLVARAGIQCEPAGPWVEVTYTLAPTLEAGFQQVKDLCHFGPPPPPAAAAPEASAAAGPAQGEGEGWTVEGEEAWWLCGRLWK